MFSICQYHIQCLSFGDYWKNSKSNERRIIAEICQSRWVFSLELELEQTPFLYKKIAFLKYCRFLLLSELCQCNEKLSFSLSRNSCPVVFCRRGVLRNCAKFTCKHLCQSLFFNKMQALGLQLYLKLRLWHRCFPFEFCQIYNNIILYRTPPVVASAFHVIRYL